MSVRVAGASTAEGMGVPESIYAVNAAVPVARTTLANVHLLLLASLLSDIMTEEGKHKGKESREVKQENYVETFRLRILFRPFNACTNSFTNHFAEAAQYC